MKLAIIADVHSNIHALEKVRKHITEEGADAVACAGDVVGYGAFPNECCLAIEAMATYFVLGNHDAASLSLDTSRMNPYAEAALLWTRRVLSASSTSFLKRARPGIRFCLADRTVAMFHGSPKSVEEYIFEEDVDEDILKSAKADVVILGHTHVPYVKEYSSGLIINPGSVGQPRDGNPRSSYAVLDSEKMRCRILRVGYDMEAAADAIRSADLPSMLADRLLLGR